MDTRARPDRMGPGMDEQLPLTLGNLARAVGGTLRAGDPSELVPGLSIDSRALNPGDLFVAIAGARFDGHAFVADALARGAMGALVSDEAVMGASSGPSSGAALVVKDTLAALQMASRYVRRASGARVVAITGSAGKTTTKELTAAALASSYRVFRSQGNLNNQIGLPLSLLELRTRPEIAVVELGMNAPGEIGRLVEIAEPEFRVWTNVTEAHAEFFPSIEAIADAKAEILDGATDKTVVVANADDGRVMARVANCLGRVTTFGMHAAADVTATEIEDCGLDGTRAVVRTPVGPTRVATPLLGRGNLANVLAALTVAIQLEVPLAAASERVATVEAPPGRGQVHRLANGVMLVDDSYNANPTAVITALETLAKDRRDGRRVAVLGEMLELGRHAESLHADAGRAVASAGVELLVTVGGGAARALGKAAIEAGLGSGDVLHCDDSETAAVRLSPLLRDGDLVLVKGSRGVRTETVVTRLVAERT
jgi:UDP-N-acetylmuramoyl-tripeptide--D-alanyl-D-alanine ligase